jgi:hypothetical protein
MIIDGPYADQYSDPSDRELILQAYNQRYKPVQTPFTDPMQYDPFNPPEGWRYDPFYETWVHLKND